MAEETEVFDLISYGKSVFYKTLVGRVYKYLKKHQEGITANIVKFVMKKGIKKGNGRDYRFESLTDCKKAVLGTVSTGIFTVDKDVWQLVQDRAKEYKQVKVRKYYNKNRRSTNGFPLNAKAPKLFRRIKFLKRSLSELKSKKETENLFFEPFKVLEGNEDILEAAQKVGREKFLGMIEGFLITTKYFNKIMNKNYQNGPCGIQDKLISIHERLKKFDKYLGKRDDQSSAKDSR